MEDVGLQRRHVASWDGFAPYRRSELIRRHDPSGVAYQPAQDRALPDSAKAHSAPGAQYDKRPQHSELECWYRAIEISGHRNAPARPSSSITVAAKLGSK